MSKKKYINPHVGEIIDIDGKQYRIKEYNPSGDGVCEGCAFEHTYCDRFDVPGDCFRTILKEVHSGDIHDETDAIIKGGKKWIIKKN